MQLTHSCIHTPTHSTIYQFPLIHPSIHLPSYPFTTHNPPNHRVVVRPSIHPPTQSFKYRSIHPLNHSPINSSTNPFFRSPKHTHSTIHPAIHALIHPLTPSSLFPVIHSPVHARMHLLNHLSQTTYSFETTAFVSNVATVLSWIAIMIPRLE